MSVWVLLILSTLAVVVFFGGIYGLIGLVVEGRKFSARPKLGLAGGTGLGTLGVWVDWKPEQYALQIYRLKISHVSPSSKVKEGMFTITFDPPLDKPFFQTIELPDSFKSIINRDVHEKSLWTFEFRTVDEMSLHFDYTLKKIKSIVSSAVSAVSVVSNVPKALQQLKTAAIDHPTIMTLDYAELVEWKSKLKTLEAAAKAKAAKTAAAAAKPSAPAPAAPSTPSASTTQPPVVAAQKLAEPTAAAAPSTPSTPTDQPVKSVRDVVSATNSKKEK